MFSWQKQKMRISASYFALKKIPGNRFCL